MSAEPPRTTSILCENSPAVGDSPNGISGLVIDEEYTEKLSRLEERLTDLERALQELDPENALSTRCEEEMADIEDE